MTIFTYPPTIASGYNLDGTTRPVKNEEMVVLLTELMAVVEASATGGLLFDDRSELDATLAHDAGTMAIVAGDSAANDGMYRKIGASGAGAWVKVISGVPGYNLTFATNAGAGTANAVQATTTLPVTSSMLVVVPFVAANTGAMTLSINGEVPRDLVTNTGDAIPAGYMVAGMLTLVVLDANGDYRLFSYGDASAIQAAAEAARVAAETAAANAIAAVATVSVVTSQAEFIEALSASGRINVSTEVTDVTLASDAEVTRFLDKVHLINSGEVLTVNLPEGQNVTANGDIARISSWNANTRIIGAAPIETSASSVASITGGPGAWFITYNVADATGIAVGHYAKLFDVRPLPILSGDNIASYILDDYPVIGEIANPFTNIGACTIVNGGGSASFAGGIGALADSIAVGDLLTVKGQTFEVTAVGASTVTVNGAWTNGGVSQTAAYCVTNRANGTVSTAGSSQVVTGVGTAFLSQANIGDVILAAGKMRKITAIASDTSLTVDAPVNLSAGTVFSLLQVAACLHEGVHEITAVGANTVTVKNLSSIKPPLNGVSVDEFKALKTILINTGPGDGFVFEQNGALRELDNVALVGSGLSTAPIGILLQNRVESELAGDGVTSFGDVTQHGLNGTILLGENVGVTRFGTGAMIGHHCDLDGRKGAFNANLLFGVWILDAGFATLRRAAVLANGSHGVLNSGGTIITEARLAGNGGDGIQTALHATTYGEAPMAVANAGMNYRGPSEITDGVSLLAGASGVYSSGGHSVIDRLIVGANARAGVELINHATLQCDHLWITGTSNTAGAGYGFDIDHLCKVNATHVVCEDNEGGGINIGIACTMVLKDSLLGTFSGVDRLDSPASNGAVIWTGTGADSGASVPAIGSASGSISAHSFAAIAWTRDKDRYLFDGGVTINNIGTATGYLTMSLPFAAAAVTQIGAVNSTDGQVLAAYVSGSTAYIYAAAGGFPVTSGKTIKISGHVRA